MKKLVTLLAAALALGLVAFTPDVASAGKGWKGGHWHGHGWRGGHWRGYRGWRGPRYASRGWGYRRSGWGWGGWGGWGGGWWGPGISIAIGPGFYGRRCWSPSYGYYPCRRYAWGY